MEPTSTETNVAILIFDWKTRVSSKEFLNEFDAKNIV